MIAMDCQSGYSYHQLGKQLLGGCSRNRESQFSKHKIRKIASLVWWRAVQTEKCSVLCCIVIDAYNTSNDV